VLLASALAYVVIAVPLFRLIDTGRGAAVLAATALFVAVHAGLNGPEPAVVAERLPTSVRFTGLALAYNLAFALFGGTAPLVATSLIASTGDLAAPAWYVSAVAAAGSVLLWRLGPPSGDPGDGVEIGATGSGTPRSG
jgi:MHS family proline/betaine transporter-like MFS transporter